MCLPCIRFLRNGYQAGHTFAFNRINSKPSNASSAFIALPDRIASETPRECINPITLYGARCTQTGLPDGHLELSGEACRCKCNHRYGRLLYLRSQYRNCSARLRKHYIYLTIFLLYTS